MYKFWNMLIVFFVTFNFSCNVNRYRLEDF